MLTEATMLLLSIKKLGFTTNSEVDLPIGQGYFMNDYVMQKEL